MITFKDLSEKLVDVTQRKKAARRMAKLAKTPSFQLKKKKSLMKMRNPAKLAVVARKKTIQSFRDKFYPGYKTMSLQQKVKTDQLIMQNTERRLIKSLKKQR